MKKLFRNLVNCRAKKVRLFIISSVLTFLVGVGLTQIRPFREWKRTSEWLHPGFSRVEAEAQIGHQVRCVYHTNRMSGGCEAGERGEVLGVEKVPGGEYFIVVHWNDQNADEHCYYGRYSRRLFLAVE
jgi:hypothetical protein